MRGWFRDNYRHSLAAKGIKTRYNWSSSYYPPGHVPAEPSLECVEFARKLAERKVVKKGALDLRKALELRKQSDELESQARLLLGELTPESYCGENVDEIGKEATNLYCEAYELRRQADELEGKR